MKGFKKQNKSKKKYVSIKNTNSSKEGIINQAFNFHAQGNISEAVKYYQYCINQNFNDHRVFSNYGVILNEVGKLKEAELSLRKAIELQSDFAEAHSNLGTILRDLGKLKEAELSTRKAIQLKPDFVDAHFNLGNILRNLGKLREAELSQRKVIELNPYLVEAHSNLGIILNDLGQSKEAFECYLKANEINPKDTNIYQLITRFLRDSDPSELNQAKLKKILNLLLEKNIVPHTELFNAFNFIYRNQILINLEKLDFDSLNIKQFMNDKLIIKSLKKIIFENIELEKLLTKIREYLCYQISKNRKIIIPYKLEFIIALGEQCFLNEYVYTVKEEENLSINLIINRCKNGAINEQDIAILSCYFPLHKLINKIPSITTFNSPKQSFKELIKLQVSEPIEEIQLSKQIKVLGKIHNNISKKVKSQYEENPYPRWRYGNPSKESKFTALQTINTEVSPNSIRYTSNSDQLNILIAGSGTGYQILQAQRYKNAKIIAIDLSSTSLAYSQRKINELDIKNVELIQMDLLEVSLIKKEFDIIECSGVLHHMNNPSEGLAALLKILKPTGFMKLGLYSELARRDIVKAREYIINSNLISNDKGIKNLRENVIYGNNKIIKNLKNWGNFYTTSECRDLCFHEQEHRFTIKQLKETIGDNQLKFLGFLLSAKIKYLYKKYFPEDKTQTNLNNWANFEEKHTNTFRAMYQFWVCKTKNSHIS